LIVLIFTTKSSIEQPIGLFHISSFLKCINRQIPKFPLKYKGVR